MKSAIKVIGVMVLLLVALFLFTACDKNDGPTGDVIVNDECSEFEESAKDDCYLDNIQCSKISNELVRDNCVLELAKLKHNFEVCNLIKNEQVGAHCQETVAEVVNEVSLCELINNSYWKNNCFYNLAINNNNESPCGNIFGNGDQRNRCYHNIATSTNNYLICTYLIGVEKEKCFLEVVKETLNTEICKEFNTVLGQDSCYFKIAKLADNEEYCDLISFDVIKEDCQKVFTEK
jgi:hypothetical protein